MERDENEGRQTETETHQEQICSHPRPTESRPKKPSHNPLLSGQGLVAMATRSLAASDSPGINAEEEDEEEDSAFSSLISLF